jgi:hypothetical protein
MEDSPGLFATIQIVPSRDSEDCLLVANVVKREMRLELVNVDTPAVTIAHRDGGNLLREQSSFNTHCSNSG